jgi:hypothetical protein
VNDPITKTLREEEFMKTSPVRVGRGYVTSDGQYWIESNCSSVKTGTWFDSVGHPNPHWAETWAFQTASQVMSS